MKNLPDEDKLNEGNMEVGKAEVPQWALELKASIEKLTDTLTHKQMEEDEEKPPAVPEDEEEKKKQEEEEEEEEPEEEKKQEEPEKYPPEEEEKKKSLDNMIADAMSKATKDLGKMVEKEIAKRLETLPDKRSIVPGEVKSKGLTINDLHKMDWRQVHELAKNMGA